MELAGLQCNHQETHRRKEKKMQREELKSVMALWGDSQKDLAAALGRTEANISEKISGKTVFRQDEISAIALRYKLTSDDIQRIFFAETVT